MSWNKSPVSYLPTDILLLQHQLLKNFSFPHWNLVLLSKLNWPHVSRSCLIYFRTLYTVPLIYMSVLTLILHYLDSCSLIVGLKIGQPKPSSIAILIQNALAILSPLTLHGSFRITCQFPKENLLEFWVRLLTTGRSIWNLTSFRHWLFQFTNMI